MKKEKTYDLGIFGKWSKETLLEQIYYDRRTGWFMFKDDSALKSLVDSLLPNKPKFSIFKIKNYIDKKINYYFLMDEYNKDYVKVNNTLRVIVRSLGKRK